MKKLLAVILAIVMICSLSISAFADEVPATHTISVATGDTHTYAVYQIFTGTLSSDNKTLSDIRWGQNAKVPYTDAKGNVTEVGDLVPDEVLKALVAADGNDQAKLEVILDYVDPTSTSYVDASSNTVLVDATHTATVPNGYYLMKDLGVAQSDGSYVVPDNQELAEYVTKIVTNVTITKKWDETSTDKEVGEKNDSVSEDITWADGADHDIGDAINFKLEATITEKYDNYDEYYFAFHDEQSDGLTFNKSSVKVYLGDYEIPSDYYTVYEAADTNKPANFTTKDTFMIEFKDLKGIEISVPAAEQGKDPTIVKVAGGDTITALYTSTLNSGAVIGDEGNINKMYGEYSNKPHDEGTGKTTPDTVIVFTYELDADKVKENAEKNGYEPLAGAGFTLFKWERNEDRLDENKESDPGYDWVAVGSEQKGAEKTEFSWPGMDAGKYKLVETTTPDGYNTMEPIEFTIVSEITDEELTALTVKDADGKTIDPTKIPFSADLESGIITGDIVNEKGTILPETGGIGTTIFYVLGGILLVGAAVLLITKKRMGAKG